MIQYVNLLLNTALILPPYQVIGKERPHTSYYNITQSFPTTCSNDYMNDVHSYNITLSPNFEINRFVTFFYHIKHSRPKSLSIPINIRKDNFKLVILIISGDVSVNPGPIKNP